MSETKFRTHTEPQAKLQFCSFWLQKNINTLHIFVYNKELIKFCRQYLWVWWIGLSNVKQAKQFLSLYTVHALRLDLQQSRGDDEKETDAFTGFIPQTKEGPNSVLPHICTRTCRKMKRNSQIILEWDSLRSKSWI
jgi:hypothetical protein